MDFLNHPIFQLIIELAFFTCLTFICMFILKKVHGSSNRFLNPLEFLPEGELHTLRQVFYLILMALSFINIVYSFLDMNSSIYLAYFDLILSLIIAVHLDKSSNRNKVIFILLVPYGALTALFFGYSPLLLLDFIHVLIFIYFVKFYYDKFTEYTTANQLGTTILLLFVIIFISFFITQFVEHVNPLDSLIMVSNAFTSNGYTVLGSTIPGKLNSVFLVWSGYIISGAGTATLTAAILIKYFNKRVRELERIIDEGSDE
ncbi:hypothetical protein [Methanobrevibacter sp.]